jgi:hypothetical protein
MASVSLWIDTATRRLVAGFNSNLQADTPVFCQGDLTELDIHLLRPTGILGQLYEEIEIDPGATVRLAVGRIDAKPAAGSFRLSFQGERTPHLPHNATAEAIQSALNALSTVANSGNLTVQGNVGGPWSIYWNLLGPKGLITADINLLLPRSQAVTTVIREGTNEGAAIQGLKLKQLPAALQSDWSPLPPPTVGISRLQTGSAEANEIQRIRIAPAAYAGTFTLRYGAQSTGSLGFDATAEAVLQAIGPLPGIGEGNVSVTKVASGVWDVQFIGTLANAPQNLFTANSSSLRGFTGRTGVLNLNTPGIEDLLEGRERATATLEIEISSDSKPRTYLQMPCTVLNDMIEDLPAEPVPFEYALTPSGLAREIRDHGLLIGDFARLVPIEEGTERGLAIETLNPDGSWLRHSELTSTHP